MCCRYQVTEKVQGVFFRASAAAVARASGLHGYAINMPDGSVEVQACGDNASIVKFAEWLRAGPALADVSGLRECEVECSQPASFTTG